MGKIKESHFRIRTGGNPPLTLAEKMKAKRVKSERKLKAKRVKSERKLKAERVKSERKLKKIKTALVKGKTELQAGKSPPTHKGARLKKRRTNAYAIYIYKVLKQVHPDLSISAKGMSIMDSFMMDIFDRIAAEAGNLVKINKKVTLGSLEVQNSVRLILRGELAKHAVNEGTKAATTFSLYGRSA